MLDMALIQHPTSPIHTQMSVQVLQRLIRDAHQRESKLKLKLREEGEAQRKWKQEQANIKQDQGKTRREEGHATAQQNQQSSHFNDDFYVRQDAHAQSQPAVSIAELVQCIAQAFGMFVLGFYCHYTLAS